MSRFLTVFFALFAFALTPALAQPVDGGRAVVELISERTSVSPGETVQLGLKMDLDPKWHVYWRNAGDAGLPPEIYWADENGVPETALSGFEWPTPHLLPVVEGEIMDYGYDDHVVFPLSLTVPADSSGTLELRGTADYLICEDVCVPETAPIALTLNVGDGVENAENAALIAEWRAKVPIAFPGDVRVDTSVSPWTLSLKDDSGLFAEETLRFFPYNHEINHSADQPQKRGAAGTTLLLTSDSDEGIDGSLEGIVVTGGGAGFTIKASEGKAFADTASAAVGAANGGANSGGPFNLIAIMGAALLGGLILNLMPCVLPVLSIKAMGMVGAAAQGHTGEIRAHGIWYTLGVLLSFAVLAGAIVAIRAATGSATLGFQLQHAPTVAILTLIMFAIGLWLLGMFELGTSIQNTGNSLASKGGSIGAFFTGVLAAVVGAPCVGPFLGAALGAVMSQPAIYVFAVFLAMGFGLALPFLLLSFIPGLQKLLPKPGQWMDTLKQVFAFPMFLTAAWLLSVLGALAGYNAVAWTAAGATLIAFGVWIAGKGGAVTKVIAVAAVIAGLIYPAFIANAPAAASGTSTVYAAKYETEAWSPERVAELTAEGRPVFIDFTAVWCATCQMNKSTTLKTKAVQEAFAGANVAFLVADFTRKDPVIAEELKLRNRPGVPMYLWYAPGETEPDILPEVLSPALVIGLVEGA